ncbi:MAG: methyltransferase [Paludibacteraceae bacterium]|nr:methyltransferase [Paludibacteraceae bacterium]
MPAPISQDKEAKLGFRFRQFFVRHDHSSMKVGTDGVLLGAWAPICSENSEDSVNSEFRILDIGTGSGLIALMLAQRTSSLPVVQIDAIDIDNASCEQARDNFAASPWADRLHAAHSSLQQWLQANGRCYDLIVSNPPYFVDSLKAPDAARCAARHNDTLPFATLIADSARKLKPKGTLAVIVPTEAEDTLQALAAAEGLLCTCRCYVHPKPGRPAKRVLLAWQQGASAIFGGELTEHLTLEDEHGGRSTAYQQLTRDFYI